MMSEQINELAAALAKAQGAMHNAAMNKTNPHFKSKYADLASVIDAMRGPLSANGLSIVQVKAVTERGLILKTLLLHTSGQYISSEYPLPATTRPHEMGSALTYARRYSLSALICNATDEDDDGNVAQAAKPELVKPAPQPVRQNPHVTRAEDIYDEIDHTDIPHVPDAPKLKVKDSEAQWKALKDEMCRIDDERELIAWGVANAEAINSLPGERYKMFKGEYSLHKQNILAGKKNGKSNNVFMAG